MRFIINKLAIVHTLRSLEEATIARGDYGVNPREIKTVVFTDEPLETRRRLDVTLRAFATPDGLTLDMVSPVEACTTFSYEKLTDSGPGRYELIVLDPIVQEPVVAVPDVDADVIEELPDVTEDTRSVYEHLLEWTKPVIVHRSKAAA